MSEFAELDSVLDSMENDTSATEQTEATEATQVDDASYTEEESTEVEQEEEETSEGATEAEVDPEQAKGAKAFAAMRSENTALKNLLKRAASALGVKDLQGADLDKALENALIASEAKANNIPEEFQRKFQEQDSLIRAIAEERQREQVVNAYTALQKECGLSNEQVYAFVQELQEKGYDMQKTLPHLVDLYRGMHFTDLTQNMIDVAVQKALSRAQKGKEKSTTPDTKTGKGDNSSEEKINTVAELDALLKDVKI